MAEAHAAAPPPPALPPLLAAELTRRVTYLMLFRVVVTTLLLAAAVVAEIVAPSTIFSPSFPVLFALFAATYGLTLLWALLLPRTRRPDRLASVQVACDLLFSTALVYFTGGIDSGLVFLYILVVTGAATVLSGRDRIGAAVAAGLLYTFTGVAARTGLLPTWPGASPLEGPVLPELRTLAINLVALSAAAALAMRLAGELSRAGERIVAQGALLEDAATLHLHVVRSLTSGLMTLTPGADGATIRVSSINPTGADILGTTVPAAQGRPLDQVWPGLAARLAAGDLRREEMPLTRPDGEPRIVGLSASPLFNSAGATIGRMISFQDLSELRRMQREVERSERLAAIGRLAAGIAHEIRNPLAAISGSVELLRASSGAADGETRDLCDIVGRETDRLNHLITDLLDFARPRKRDPAPVEVGAAVAEMARVFENDPRLGGDRIELAAAPDLWVDADPGQLRQVMWNLVRNAAEASPPGSPIDVAVATEGQDVRITVRDRGPGIPDQDRPRLFEPFFSTKKGGTGLGLATVHRIVEDHRGRLELANADGGGARATVWLPRRSPPA
jgi:two-component system, NtrC family, sensor histidine kinase PilS